MQGKRIKLNGEFLYICAFVIYYFVAFIRSTMFYQRIRLPVEALKYFSIILLALKMCVYDKYRFNTFICVIFCSAVSAINYFSAGYSDFFMIVLFVVSSQSVSFDKIVKRSIIYGSALTIVALLASQVNIIEDLMYLRNGTYRHAFGSVYPTNFAAHIFYILLAHFYLRRGQLSALNYCVYIGIAAFLQVFCDTRLNIYLILILLIISLFIKQIQKEKWRVIRTPVLMFSVPLCAAITIIICMSYNPQIEWMSELNKLLSNRLAFSKETILSITLKPFGTYFSQNGLGGTTESLASRALTYSYVDISYLRIGYMYGYIAEVIICIAFVVFCRYRLKKEDIITPLCILVIAISGMVDQHLLDFSYNIFIVCFLMKIDTSKKPYSKYKLMFHRMNN